MVFEWKDNQLNCDNEQELDLFKEELFHREPKVVALPDLVDFTDDLTDGENVFNALLGIYPKAKVLVKPDEKDLYQFNDDVVY